MNGLVPGQSVCLLPHTAAQHLHPATLERAALHIFHCRHIPIVNVQQGASRVLHPLLHVPCLSGRSIDPDLILRHVPHQPEPRPFLEHGFPTLEQLLAGIPFQQPLASRILTLDEFSVHKTPPPCEAGGLIAQSLASYAHNPFQQIL